ncbi:hypothetical protein GCM10010174_06820 [Kutzneria viridogrisea]
MKQGSGPHVPKSGQSVQGVLVSSALIASVIFAPAAFAEGNRTAPQVADCGRYVTWYGQVYYKNCGASIQLIHSTITYENPHHVTDDGTYCVYPWQEVGLGKAAILNGFISADELQGPCH